jgi:ribose transport system ATP-binding protein
MAMTPAVEVRRLSKSFGPSRVLADFGLSIEPGEIHALLGANGSGKSTLIKIISGFHTPDPGGEVLIGGAQLDFGSPMESYRLGGRFLHQDRGLIPELSVLENLYLGGGYPTRAVTIRPRSAAKAARQMLAQVGLDISPGTKLADLRAAERTGVALARAVRPDPDHPPRLLVLDEPTATLPVDEVDHLHTMVRATAANNVAVLFVTHHLDEIFRLADYVTVLRDGRILRSCAVADVRRSELVDLITGGELAELEPEAKPKARAGEPALVVEDLWGAQLQGVSLSAMPGEIVGIAGITGSGRDTLLGSIFGARRYQRGTVRVQGQPLPPGRPRAALAKGAAFLPGDHRLTGGIMSLTARENITLTNLMPFSSGLTMRKRREMAEAAKWFAKVDVRPRDGIENLLSTFSGGNQQKILFAKWMRRDPAVFLLDEPTEGVDVGAKRDLHRQLMAAAQAGMTVVLSSTDVEEIEATCTKILVMRDGRIVDELTGQRITSSAVNRSVMSGTERGGQRQSPAPPPAAPSTPTRGNP